MHRITIYREDMNNPLHGNLFESLLEDLGIEHIPPYNVRHSFATNALSKTKNIATTGEMLGHSKKNGYKSTLRYAQVLQEDVDKAWDVIDGPDEKEETKVVKLTK